MRLLEIAAFRHESGALLGVFRRYRIYDVHGAIAKHLNKRAAVEMDFETAVRTPRKKVISAMAAERMIFGRSRAAYAKA